MFAASISVDDVLVFEEMLSSDVGMTQYLSEKLKEYTSCHITVEKM